MINQSLPTIEGKHSFLSSPLCLFCLLTSCHNNLAMTTKRMTSKVVRVCDVLSSKTALLIAWTVLQLVYSLDTAKIIVWQYPWIWPVSNAVHILCSQYIPLCYHWQISMKCGAPQNVFMKSMWPPLVAIFFYDLFSQDWREPWPPQRSWICYCTSTHPFWCITIYQSPKW